MWSNFRSSGPSSSSRNPSPGAEGPAARQRTRGLDPDIAGPILKEVVDRLRFLRDVGLDYLTLGRAATSLSGGETQRIRLATQIGSRLVGVLYILDEPSIGLHQRDNERLLGTLRGLRDLGNTVIVVEHDEDTIQAADHVIDLGPERVVSAVKSSPRGRSRISGAIRTRSPAAIYATSCASRCRRGGGRPRPSIASAWSAPGPTI